MTQTVVRLTVVLLGVVLVGLACRQQTPTPREQSLAVYPTGIKGEPQVRILAVENADKLDLSVTGPYRLEVVHLDGRKETGGDEKPATVGIVPTARGVQIGRDEVQTATVTALGDAKLLIDGQPLPGTLTFYSRTADVGGKPRALLQMVVRLGMEQYLAGVLPNEMQASWPLEALRAQAVAARTYALYHVKTREKQPFDVRSSIASQVWRPSLQSIPRVNMAVNSTRGLVLTDNFRLFPTFFHAQCGFQTANGNPVFISEDLIALLPARCPSCSSSDGARRWRFEITKADLATRLRQAGLIRGDIASLRKLDRSRRPQPEMERAYYIEVTSKGGVVQVVEANRFRGAIGGGREELPSTWFTLVDQGDRILFEGRGFGHGVGLCQYGAKHLAETGVAFDGILAHYYTGTTIVRLWGEND